MKGLGKLSPSTVKVLFFSSGDWEGFIGVFLEMFSHLHHLTPGHWRELGNLNPTGNPSLGHKSTISQALVFSVLCCGDAGLRHPCPDETQVVHGCV